MNSKKHKNRNRSKVLPTPPQKIKNTEAENAVQHLQCAENLKLCVKSEDAKQNFSVDLDTENQVRDETNQLKESSVEGVSLNFEQVPVKPKRNKNKKKKRNANEVCSENFSDDGKKIERVDKEVINIIETNPSELKNQEKLDVPPSTPRKKNRDKKVRTISNEHLNEDVSNTEIISNDEITKDDVEEDRFVVHCANKKNKKKKRRHDSEKSEKTDKKLSCVAAFNDLINADDPGEVDEQYNRLCEDNVITCSTNPDTSSQTGDCFTSDVSKNDVVLTKKKKKKERKHLPKPEPCNQYDVPNVINVDSNIANSEHPKAIEKDYQTENVPSTYESVQCNEPKQKAIIAKPVKKKTAGAADNQEDREDKSKAEEKLCYLSSDNNNCEEIKSEKDSPQLPKLTTNDSRTEDSQNIKPPDIVFESSADVNFSSEKLDKSECLQTSEDTTKIKKDDYVPPLDNIEQNFRTLYDELDAKILPNIDMDITSKNIESDFEKLLEEIPSGDIKIRTDVSNQQDCNNIEATKEENHETIESDKICDNTPDYIQIPRSSSQHLFADNNNNTVIQEITPNDELKLGIPVLTSNIIQGSGETPASTPKIKSEDVSFTEIESIPDKDAEKTDLKTKMLEVNQELEEIKMSLEKSLAEIPAVGKTDEKKENVQHSIVQTDTENIAKIDGDKTADEVFAYKPLADRLNEIENKYTPLEENQSSNADNTLKEQTNIDNASTNIQQASMTPPVCPSRKDRKGKGKTKKGGRREPGQSTSQTETTSGETKSNESNNKNKNEEKSKTDEKGKQKSGNENRKQNSSELNFEPIESFEDVFTSSVDDADVNETFEIIANELNSGSQIDKVQKELKLNKPEINITPPAEDNDKEKQTKNVHPISQPKNFLGHCNTTVQSNKTDYKKEKNRTPNTKQAKVKIKDAIEPETGAASAKDSKKSQTGSGIKFANNKNEIKSFSYVTNEKEEYVYKYSFRKVYLSSLCCVCRKELKQTRLPCNFCNLLFYCSQKHKDEDWPRHQSLCFAVSTIVHLKDQKHIYSDAKGLSGQNYRLIRMQMILSCEKVLKRKLLPWEQEALLYPRICADIQCREWKQSKLRDCNGCGQVSYCIENPEHLPASHQRWCKSYALYQKLVLYQELNGKLEPKLPSKVIEEEFILPGKMNEVLASMYDEKIDMTDIQYAALTQLATAPLTTAFSYQTFRQLVNCSNGFTKKSTFTVHVVGADLQFEADSLNKWEVFLLHLKPDVQVLRVELVGQKLNPYNLPLNLLGKITQCVHCRKSNRRLQISFHDKSYKEYWSGDDFTVPDIVCAFNPSIQRSSAYEGRECWPAAINCILKQKVPFLVTSHTLEELKRDLESIRDCIDMNFRVVAEPKHNPFASFRPDRNFITDEETPLLFKNYCFSILCGV